MFSEINHVRSFPAVLFEIGHFGSSPTLFVRHQRTIFVGFAGRVSQRGRYVVSALAKNVDVALAMGPMVSYLVQLSCSLDAAPSLGETPWLGTLP